MNPTYFYDPVTFPLTPPACWNFWHLAKYLNKLGTDSYGAHKMYPADYNCTLTFRKKNHVALNAHWW